MLRWILTSTATCALALALCGDTWGHGGQLRGPSPTYPGTGLPPGTGGPTGPGGGGPVTPGGGGGGGPATGGGFFGGKKPAAPDYTEWDTWWEYNREPYLQLRERLGSRRAVTGPDAAQLRGVRPTFAELKDTALPALREALKSDDSDVVDSAVLAIARITPAEHGDLVYDDVLGVLKRDDATIQRAALLALGILGHPKAGDVLRAVMKDEPAGRQALAQKGRVPDLMRGYAALSLGLLGDSAAQADLMKMAQDSGDDVDREALAILALGLLEHDRPEIVMFLSRELEDSRQNDLIRAQIPIALSRLGQDAAPMTPALLKLARNKRVKDPLRRSAVIALGRLAGPEDVEVRDGLIQVARDGTDDAVTHFAFVALGEIGARAAAEPARSAEFLAETTKFLLRQVDRPETKDRLPFAATGAALLGRALQKDDDTRATICRKVREAFEQTNNPLHQSALAVCLGLLEDREAGGAILRKEFQKTADEARKGYYAIGLGLMRDDAAAALFRKELKDVTNPGYRSQLAIGLGLLGDPDVSDELARELGEAKTLFETASLAKALGTVGDRSALEPLLDLVSKKKRGTPGLTRAFGCVALGLLGEKTDLPWNSRLAVGSNYLTVFFGQSEVLDLL